MKKVIDLFNNSIVPNDDVKYSTLLERFISKFEHEFIDYEFMEDVIQLGLSAWNFGNMSLLMPKDEFKKIMDHMPKEDVRLFKRMIAHKAKEFKEYTNFIVEFELEEAIGDPILSVTTQTEENHMADLMETLSDQSSEADFEENYINRTAIIVKPLQPFIDWYCKLYPEDCVERVNETSIYLISEEINDKDTWLSKKFDRIFKLQLEECHLNKKEWPQKRTYKMLNEWFQVDVSPWVYDLENTPVSKIEF